MLRMETWRAVVIVVKGLDYQLKLWVSPHWRKQQGAERSKYVRPSFGF